MSEPITFDPPPRAPNGRDGRTLVCRTCRERKYLSEFPRHPTLGRDTRCNACNRAYQKRHRKGTKPPTHFACVDCGCRTRRHKRCAECREAFQRQAEAASLNAEYLTDVTLCQVPIHGGACHRVLFTATDWLGRTVTICSKHGERLVELQRPENFVRYSQGADAEKELAGFVRRAQQPAKPHPKASGRTWQKNFHVVGRDQQRRIEAA